MPGPALASPPTYRPGGSVGLPAPLTLHTTSPRRLNAGSSRAASNGSISGPRLHARLRVAPSSRRTSRAASNGSNSGPRIHARLRAAPLRPADSPPARRYAALTSFFQYKNIHSHRSTHISSTESSRTVSDRAALSRNCTFRAHAVHTNMKGFSQPCSWHSPVTDQNFPPPGRTGQKETVDIKRRHTDTQHAPHWTGCPIDLLQRRLTK